MTTTEALQQIFRDNFVSYFRSHVAHVNIVGRNFASDHKLLQKTYEDLQSQIDTLGELLRTLQEYMPCDIQEVLDESSIDTGEIQGSSITLIELVLNDLEHLASEHRELIVVADKDGEHQISNYAQDRVLALEKHIWMFKATLED
jgi:starvation-inducible DNA-binding protein